LTLIPQMLAISFVTFMLVRLLPGNPAYQLLGPLATEDSVAAMSKRMGLDRPLLEQYWYYLVSVLQGDLGTSWYTSRPVSSDLLERFPATFELISISLLLGLVIGILAGLITAFRNRG